MHFRPGKDVAVLLLIVLAFCFSLGGVRQEAVKFNKEGVKLLKQEKYEEAIDTFEGVLDRISGIYIFSLLGCLYGIIGNKEKARKTIEEIDKLKEGKPGSNFSYSLVYAGMNDMDNFFMYLNKANKERTGLLIFLDILRRGLVPGFKNNAKLLEYMKKEGLPIYPF